MSAFLKDIYLAGLVKNHVNKELLIGCQDLAHASEFDHIIQPEILLNDMKYENAIINGCFTIPQRGTTFAAIANNAYHLDRWYYRKVGTMVHTITQEDGAIGALYPGSYACKVDTTTADVAIGIADLCTIGTTVEGGCFRPFQNNYAVLSFWVRSAKTGVHCVSFRNFGKDRSYVAEYTIAVINTWEYKEIIIHFDEIAGTWNYTNEAGIRIEWALSAGTNFHTTADSWNVGDFLSTNQQVNVCDTIGNEFRLRDVKLNIGRIACKNPLNCNAQSLLAGCQRYFEKSYNLDVVPGAVTDIGAVPGAMANTHTFILPLFNNYITPKRSTPIVKWYSNTSGDIDRIRNISTAANVVVNQTDYRGRNGIGIPVVAAAVNDGDIIAGHWTADAEITP